MFCHKADLIFCILVLFLIFFLQIRLNPFGPAARYAHQIGNLCLCHCHCYGTRRTLLFERLWICLQLGYCSSAVFFEQCAVLRTEGGTKRWFS